MFLEIQLSVIKSGCHPDSWWQSEERRIKKPADVSCVGTDLQSTQQTTTTRGMSPLTSLGAALHHNSIVVMCRHHDYLVVV